MSSKTKIIVLHLKEVIYTGIFALLGILFIILLLIMFLPGKESKTAKPDTSSSYIPGVYTTSLVLNDNTIDIEVVVDESNINSIRLVNLSESVATMYPLIKPSFDDLVQQIYEKQSLEGITYAEDNKYTSLVLLDTIRASLEKAVITTEE